MTHAPRRAPGPGPATASARGSTAELPGRGQPALPAELIAGGQVQPDLRRHRRRAGVGRPHGRRSGHVLATAHDMAPRVPRHVGAAGHRRAGARDLRAVRPTRGARRAVLRDGAGATARRTGTRRELAPLGPERTRDDLRAPGGHARRPARGRPGDGGARRLRPARGLPRPAGAPLEEAAGRLAQPRPARLPTSCTRRLAATCRPSPRAGIVHGDYRLDNVLVDDADRVGRRPRLGDGHRSATR